MRRFGVQWKWYFPIFVIALFIIITFVSSPSHSANTPKVTDVVNNLELSISGNTLQFIEKGKPAVEIYRWSNTGTVLVWRWKNGILLGLTNVTSDNSIHFEWICVHLSDENLIPKVVPITGLNNDPKELKQLSYVKQAELLFLTFRNPAIKIQNDLLYFTLQSKPYANEDSNVIHPLSEVIKLNLVTQQTNRYLIYE